MFDYKEAEKRLRAGATKIRRSDWSGNSYLVLENEKPRLHDLDYDAYWDLTPMDLASADWVEES